VGFAAHNTNVKSFAVMRLAGRSTRPAKLLLRWLMDDMRLFNYAISAAKVTEIMGKGENPLQAYSPKPANGATPAINQATPLSWSKGEKASQHDVYFGLDGDAVANADASDKTGIYRGRQGTTSYTPPEGVQLSGGPYYWRIDELNSDGTITAGSVWSFSVADYVLVEDFESYNDIAPDRLAATSSIRSGKTGLAPPPTARRWVIPRARPWRPQGFTTAFRQCR